MGENDSGLEVRGLYKEYPAPGEPLAILRGVDVSLADGEALAVMGPSGSGKSTLLHILGSLDTPTRGEVRLHGRDPFGLDPAGLAQYRNRQVGFVFQDHHLLPQCSALENVLIPSLAYPERAAGAETDERARRLLDRVGLSGRLEHRPAELSGGERQRVSIARALIYRAPLLLADEPTGNLDRKTAEAVSDLLLELQQEEGTILVLVTHSAELAGRFERRAELIDGRLELS